MSDFDFYKIIELVPESPENFEPLGSKRKFWLRLSTDKQPWLFKYARGGTGEAWAEKIAQAQLAENC